MNHIIRSVTGIVLCLSICLLPPSGMGQDANFSGLPFMTNFSPEDYNSHPQNWQIAQNSKGKLYFANSQNLVEYDGVHWQTIDDSRISIVRSIDIDEQDRVFIGSSTEMGYFEQDSTANWHYFSLTGFLPEQYRSFNDIWTTYITPEGIYFQAREYIFLFSQTDNIPSGSWEVKVWDPEESFLYAFFLDDTYFVHQRAIGLQKMGGGNLQTIPGTEILGQDRMNIMLPFHEEGETPASERKYLLGLFRNGFYTLQNQQLTPFESKVNEISKTYFMYKGLKFNNQSFVLSSVGDGIIVVDFDGKIIQRINKSLGLYDNSVYALFKDDNHALWLGLDHGISRVEMGFPLTIFGESYGIKTSILSIKRFEGDLYLGTTNGLMKQNRVSGIFETISQIPFNQVFDMLILGDELIVPADGLFSFRNGRAVTLQESIAGQFQVSSIYQPASHPNILLTGLQNGISILKKDLFRDDNPSTRGWSVAGFLPGITENCWNFAESGDGTIWVGTQNNLLLSISNLDLDNIDSSLPDIEVSRYDEQHGLPATNAIPYKWKDRVIFATPLNVYTFSSDENRFEVDSTFTNSNTGITLGGDPTEYSFKTDYKNRIWINFGGETGLAVPNQSEQYDIVKAPFKPFTSSSIVDIYPESNSITWLAGYGGLIRYDENVEKDYERPFATYINFVASGEISHPVSNDTEIAYYSIPYRQNSILFKYNAPYFEHENKTLYQTFLQGFDDSWSDWGNLVQKEYTNLPEGRYTFHTRAQNIYGQISEEAQMSFRIYPPWYRSWWAYLLYASALIGLGYIIIRWRTSQLKARSRELEQEVAERTADMQSRMEELAVINSVQRGLVEKMDMQSIYELVGEKLRELFDANTLVIRTFDTESNLEVINYAIEKGKRLFIKDRPQDLFSKHLLVTKELISINTGFREYMEKYGSDILEGEAPKSAVFAPLISGNHVFGNVSLQNVDQENAFTDNDIKLLGTLTNSMSVALENARLFEESNRLLKETQQRSEELAVINSVQEGLVAQMEMKKIYALVGDKIRNVFDAQAVVINTYDHLKELNHYQYIFEKGEYLELDDAIPFNDRDRYIIRSKEALVINADFERRMKEFGALSNVKGEAPKSVVWVPMLVGDKVAGCISLQNIDRENAFSQSDVSLLNTLTNSMSVALENARLFEETNRLLEEVQARARELSVINSIQEGLVAQMDIQGIFNLVGNQIRDIFNAQVVTISSFEPDSQLDNIRYMYEKGTRLYPKKRSINAIHRKIIKSKENLVVNEHTIEFARRYGIEAIPDSEFPKSIVFVPLVVGSQVKGWISLQNIDKEFAFSESDVNLMTTLANSMSIALENARLFDESQQLLTETQQRNNELAVINSIQEGLVAQMNIQGIYDLVGDKIREIFNAQCVTISDYDPENNLDVLKYHFEDGQKLRHKPRTINNLHRILLENKDPILIEENFSEYIRNVLNEDPTPIPGTELPKSLVYVPLILGNRVRGWISLQNLEIEFAFSQSDVSLLTTLANSMTIALENARLFDESQILLQETQQRNNELAVINSIQEGLVAQMDIQRIFDLVGEKIEKIFDAQVVSIASYDHEKELCIFQFDIEKGKRFYDKPRKLNKVDRQLIQTRQSIFINENLQNQFDVTPAEGTEMPMSAMWVPLIIGDKVNGHVSLQNIDREHAFSNNDQSLLITLANSMSIALENARLFDRANQLLHDAEQRAEELQVINKVQEGLVKQVELQGIFEFVGESLQNIVEAQTIVISSFDHEISTEYFNYATRNGEAFKIKPRTYDNFTRHIIDNQKSLVINENFGDYVKKYIMEEEVAWEFPKSAVFVPIMAGKKVVGNISLQNLEKENAYSRSEVTLLETLVNSISVALENARLFEETELRAAEMSTVNSVSQAIAKKLELEQLIQLVGQSMRDLFNCNIAYIALLDKENGIINFPYGYGDIYPPMKLGQGLTSDILITGKSKLINENVDSAYEDLGIERTGVSSASYVGVPIPMMNEYIGVLSVQSTEKSNRFNESDVHLLETIASNVGIAIYNARLFEDAEKSRMLAEEANEAKSAFLSTVSHELRTPLTSVLGFAKIIKKRLEDRIFPQISSEDDKLQRIVRQISENLKVVVSEGQRLTNLINDVLDLAKIEAGKIDWHMESLKINDVVERAIAATTALFEDKGLKLTKKFEPKLPEVSGDMDKLIQVVVNLLSNAVKFTDKGSIHCSIKNIKGKIQVSITDSGIGIAEEDLPIVFEKFKQVGDTLTDKPKGTGLGLPICREIVEHHGGKIWVESKLSKGSTFSFSIPLHTGKNGKVQKLKLNDLIAQIEEKTSGSGLMHHFPGKTILVVDDEQHIRELLLQELSFIGYDVVTRNNGKEGIEWIRHNPADLIVMDIKMPEMDGYDMAAILKNDPATKNIPIIMLSVLKDEKRGYGIGIDKYLTKPIDTDELMKCIAELLSQGSSRKKVMVVDEDSSTIGTLMGVLKRKGYKAVESNGKELMNKAMKDRPDIIIMKSGEGEDQETIRSLRMKNEMENVLFLIYE